MQILSYTNKSDAGDDIVLDVDGLAFAWQGGDSATAVFREVSFKVRRGEHVAIIGPNGAGKSTLLRCIAGLLKPQAGSVTIQGRPLGAMKHRELARRVAFLPQDSGARPGMPVRDLVMTGRYPYFAMFAPVSHEDRQAAEDAMAIAGVTQFADRRFDELSGGERQRVMLASAIAQGAGLLLLDEPFTFLDPAGQSEFSAIIARLRSERGVTVVTVTHDLARAAADGCRAIGLSRGGVCVDAPANIAYSPDMLERVFGCAFNTWPAAIFAETEERAPTSAPEVVRVAESAPCRHPLLVFLGYALLAVVAFALTSVIAASIGAPYISPFTVAGDMGGTDAAMFFRLRLPRSMTAFLVGSALSVAGLVFQAMFRNPLATPYTLGVSGGASFGAMFALQFAIAGTLLGSTAMQCGAFAGAMLSIAIVYGTFRLGRRASVTTMLLAGVGCSFLFSSLIMLMQYISDPTNTIHTLYWMMGGVFVSGYKDVLGLMPALAVGLAAASLLVRELDVMLLGDEVSAGRGVNVGRVRTVLFLAVSLMTASVVSLCGPIGFVGMVVPHVCRMALGPVHRRLLPVAAVAGGVFLSACDVIARTVISPAEIPIGVITSLFGAPFLLYLLRGNREM